MSKGNKIAESKEDIHKMIICITGTPGTGKSIVAKALAKKIRVNLIEISKLEVPYKWDIKRKTKAIEIADIRRAIKRKLTYGANIIDGHLSHHIKSDILFVLRCDPIALKKRLIKKGWSEKKIKENVMAELLDIIWIEALQEKLYKKIFLIDTTNKKSKETINIISSTIKNKKIKLEKQIPWLKKYKSKLNEFY